MLYEEENVTKPEEEITDFYDLPVYENCNYIRVNSKDIRKIETFFEEEDIPHKVFEDSKTPYFEDIAENKLRDLYVADNTKDGALQDALFARGKGGEALLFANKAGTLLNDKEIDSVIESFFEKYEEGEIDNGCEDEDNDLINEELLECMEEE